jgi:hypothetical protein
LLSTSYLITYHVGPFSSHFLVRIIGFDSYTTLKDLDQFFQILNFFWVLKIRLVFIFMNKNILACFQDDRFSLIFEPLVSELLMIELVLAWICACQRMHIFLLFTGDISPKIQIQKSSVSWRFSIVRFLCLVFSA